MWIPHLMGRRDYHKATLLQGKKLVVSWYAYMSYVRPPPKSPRNQNGCPTKIETTWT